MGVPPMGRVPTTLNGTPFEEARAQAKSAIISTVEAAFAEILAGLRRLRISGHRDTFGSAQHDFDLNPPLPESSVSDVEFRHRVRLPVDYRAFLLHAGN